MTPESWTVLLVGIGLAGLVFRMDAHVRMSLIRSRMVQENGRGE